MEYQKFEALQKQWKGKVCLFGTGLIGRTWGYDVISLAGFHIDFYCDNNMQEGTIIRDGLKTLSLEKLYKKKNSVLVFITVSIKNQKEIWKQLTEQGIMNIVTIDYLFLQKFCESVIASDNEFIIKKYYPIVNDEEYLKRQFKYKCGYSLNLKTPKTFNEKLQWLKLNNRNENYIQMVDKLAAKKYVAEKIGEQYIIPTIGVWDTVEDIDFDKLPKEFVLKCTHDSGGVIIVNDKNKIDINTVKEKLKGYLEKNFYYYAREWPYLNIKPKIIAEEYIGKEIKEPINDYKLMCFNGKHKCSFVCSERFDKTRLKVTFYDADWKLMPFERHYPKSNNIVEKPYNYFKMIEFAETLSKNIPFLRVDFYEVEKKVYFGELTFYPGAGFEEFDPFEWDIKLGEWIKLF